MATTVRITETYDLKTEVGKIGLIGIHTPTYALLTKLYPGLVKNHRFVRFKKCDIVGACASILPADPLQVGVDAGDIAPEDLFNPILMRPCSNESFDTLTSRIYSSPNVGSLGSVNKSDGMPSLTDDYGMYYALLAESKRWKKAMPQKGFAMRGLYPIMHTLISTFGNTVAPGTKYVLSEDGETPVAVPNSVDVAEMDNSGRIVPVSDAVVMKGRTVRMPKIPLHYGTETAGVVEAFTVPKTFVACIVTPPARLHSFYYRMRCTWTVSFENVIPSTEYATYGVASQVANLSYQGYTYSSSKTELANGSDLVDTTGVDVNKIMES